MNSISHDVLAIILSRDASPQQLCVYALVSKLWYRIARSNRVWELNKGIVTQYMPRRFFESFNEN